MVFLQLKNNFINIRNIKENSMKKILLGLLLISQSAFAQVNTEKQSNNWVLSSKASTLNFVTTKNSIKTEVQHFQKLSGKIANNIATLNVDLNSVVTGIEIRDERLKKLFFNTPLFPQATVSIDLSSNSISRMKKGDVKKLEVNALLDIHGVKQNVKVQLQVVALDKNKRLVSANQPLIINLQKFELLEEVNELRELARLKSINAAVPVTFNLMYIQK